jgi:predicted MFS family arabinose efflux permease
MMVTTVSGFTLLQTTVADDKRGRVVSLFLLASWGMTPLGSLLLGSMAGWIGIANTFLVSGACCLAGFLWFASQLPALRPLVEAGGDEEEGHPHVLSEAHHA